jgi:hypothetical protein
MIDPTTTEKTMKINITQKNIDVKVPNKKVDAPNKLAILYTYIIWYLNVLIYRIIKKKKIISLE